MALRQESGGETSQRFSMYIDGQWTEALSRERWPVVNPATQEVVAEVAWGSRADAIRALEAADRALSGWSALAPQVRGDLLIEASRLLLERDESIAHLVSREMGKPVVQASRELNSAARNIRFLGEESKRVHGEVLPSRSSGKRGFVIKQPIGVVAIITPWNAPLNSLSYKLSAALGSGCTVVAKPAEDAPLGATELIRCFIDAGVPSGVLNLVLGEPNEVGGELIESPISRKIAFTGSSEVGKLIMRKAADRVKKITLELGGQAPLIVFDDVQVEWAAEMTAIAKFDNCGQNCLAPNRILVHDHIADEFAKVLAEKTRGLKVGVGQSPGVDVGPLINEQQLSKVERHVTDAVQKGARLLCGGSRPTDEGLDRGFFYLPTVLDGVTTDMLVTVEETFGPVAPIMRFASEEEAIEIANMTRYGLGGYVMTSDLGRAWRVAEKLEFGVVGINDLTPIIPEAPFGGIKESGLGVKGSHRGLDEFLELKYIGLGLDQSG